MKVQRVPLEFVNQVWPQVAAMLEEGLQYAPDDYTLDQIRVFVVTGQWLLLVATNDKNEICGAMTLTFFNRPNDRVAFITAVGGNGILTKDTYQQLREIAVINGATYIEAAGRDSVVRLLSRFGLKEKYTIVGAKL